jgi:hypothetical protein
MRNMRYVEVVGGVGITWYDLPKMKIGEFTRENVAEFLEAVLGPEFRPIEDFHAVCDDVEIPWATEAGREEYQRVMELAAAKRQTT